MDLLRTHWPLRGIASWMRPTKDMISQSACTDMRICGPISTVVEVREGVLDDELAQTGDEAMLKLEYMPGPATAKKHWA